MKLLYNWLKEFVELSEPASELRARLSLSGTAVDALEESAAGPVLDAEVTINRPDCLGHYGVAREISALYRRPLKAVGPRLTESAEKVESAARAAIECPELCGRYTARVLRGVTVQPSPEWLRERLTALGHGSINNVVDATNYVMLELGQPLHAYDLERLAEQRIVVRRAKPGEKMRTLDGLERALTADMCVIADGARTVGIGGIMGGAESEISVTTRNILLEAAWFEPVSTRRASKRLGLRTEASTRFERGCDPEMAEVASRRAAELIQQLAGGEILSGCVDLYPGRETPRAITFSRRELLRVMGADVPDKDIEGILDALGFAPKRVDANRGSNGSLLAEWECQSASWRRDVTREIDLVEEVARHYGFEKFPARLPPARQPAARLPYAQSQDRLRERLVALGYQEIISITLVHPERDALFRSEGMAPARISNPLSEDASILRTSGLASMAGTLEWNLNRGQRNLRLFEMGKTYELREGVPVETRILTLGATGAAREKNVHESEREFGFADVKGDLDSIGELAGGLDWEAGGPDWLTAGRAARISLKRDAGAPPGAAAPLGVAGQLARRVADEFKLRQPVYVAEVKLDAFYEGMQSARAAMRFKPLPRYPAVERDFSLLLADGIAFGQVARTIQALEIPEIRSVAAVDLFRGGQVPAGKYSLLVRVTMQSAEATLTEAQLTDFSQRIVAALGERLGASLRTS